MVAAIIASTYAAMNPQTKKSNMESGVESGVEMGLKTAFHRYSNDLPMYSMGNAGTNDSLMFQTI